GVMSSSVMWCCSMWWQAVAGGFGPACFKTFGIARWLLGCGFHHAHDLAVATCDRQLQRRLMLVVPVVDVSAFLDQQPDSIGVAVAGRQMQRRLLPSVSAVWVASFFDEKSGELVVAVARGPM